MPPSPTDQEALHLHPVPGFDMRQAAGRLLKLMAETGQTLIIHLPHTALEFEVGCTRKDLIEGYQKAIASAGLTQAANRDSDQDLE